MWPFTPLSGLRRGSREFAEQQSSQRQSNGNNSEPEEVDYFYLEGFFAETPSDKFSCPICLCPVQRKAYLTECCGRHFCHECIQKLVTGHQSCPMCKSFPLSIFPNKERQREINALAVSCPVNVVDSKENDGKGHTVGGKARSKDSTSDAADGRRSGFGEAMKSEENGSSTSCGVCDWKGELCQLENHLKAKHADDKRFRVAEKEPTPPSRPRRFSFEDYLGMSYHLAEHLGTIEVRSSPQHRHRLLSDFIVDQSSEESSDELDENLEAYIGSSNTGAFHSSRDPLLRTVRSATDFAAMPFGPLGPRPVELPESRLERSFSELGLVNRVSDYAASSSSQWGDDSERSDVEEASEEGTSETVLAQTSHDSRGSSGSGLWSLRTLRHTRTLSNDEDRPRSVADRPPTPHTSVSDLPPVVSYITPVSHHSHASHRHHHHHHPVQRPSAVQPRPLQSHHSSVPMSQRHRHQHQQRHHHRRSCPVHRPPCPVRYHQLGDNGGGDGGSQNTSGSSGGGGMDWHLSHHHHHHHRHPQQESGHTLANAVLAQHYPSPPYANPPPPPLPSQLQPPHPAAFQAAAYPDVLFHPTSSSSAVAAPHHHHHHQQQTQWPPHSAPLLVNPPTHHSLPLHYAPMVREERFSHHNNLYVGHLQQHNLNSASPVNPTAHPAPQSIFSSNQALWQEYDVLSSLQQAPVLSTGSLTALLDPSQHSVASHVGHPPPPLRRFAQEETAPAHPVPGNQTGRPGTPFAGP